MKKGKYYEQKTADIIKKQNPRSQIFQGIRIVGKLSRVSREVDVQLVKATDYDQIIFECKDHKAKVDIELVEALGTKLKDLDAKKGAIVSNSGYTKGAVNMAKSLGIDLLTIVDTDDAKIRTQVFAPNIVEDTFIESGAVRFEGLPNPGLNLDIHQTLIKVGDTFVTWPQILAHYWNTQEMKDPPEPGSYFLTTENATIIDANGKEASISRVEIIYNVSCRYYLRNLKLLETQGIYNVQRGTFQTNSLTCEPIIVKDFNDPKIWQRIEEESAKKMQVPFRITCTTPMPSGDQGSDINE